MNKASKVLTVSLLILWSGCGTTPASVTVPLATGGPLLLVDGLGTRYDVDKLLETRSAVALVFWQTWCASCKAEGPALAEAAKFYRGKIEFFGIVSGPEESNPTDELQRVTQELALPYPQIRDPDGSIVDRFRVMGSPTIIVLGAGGKELYRGRDLPADWAAPAGG